MQNMSSLNYHHLYYFQAIATHGSIVKAAETIHITPQTLSAQLNLLEQQLGYPLFDRKGKRLLLNDMGRITLSYANEIFSLGNELINSLKQQSNLGLSKFSIGVTDVIAKVFSFDFLKSVYAMDESIKLICKETSVDGLLGELATNKVDAVLSDKPLASGATLKAYSHLVGKSGLSFFAHKNLAQTLVKAFPQSLNNQPFFTAGQGSSQRHNVLLWFTQLGISPNILGEFDDSALTKYFGQAGYGVFCAPSIINEHVQEQFNVMLIGETTDITEHYYLISTEQKIKHPVIKHMLKEGKKLFEQPKS